MELVFKKEEEQDVYAVDLLIRNAFWDLFEPGCNEHYLAHVMRKSDDYRADLSLVAMVHGVIVGVIMYTRSKIIQDGRTIDTLTFGPLAVDPQWQHQGIGDQLVRKTIELARNLGEKAIIIYGHPDYYHRFGFRPCAELGIVNPQGLVIDAFMVLPLKEDTNMSLSGTFIASPIFDSVNDIEAVTAFDQSFPQREKGTPKISIPA